MESGWNVGVGLQGRRYRYVAFGFGVVHRRRSSLKTIVRGIDLCKYLGVHSSI